MLMIRSLPVPPNLRAGQEVTISYGNWPNDLFFLLFGFVPEPNPNDSVVMFSTASHAAKFVNDLAKGRGDPHWEVRGPQGAKSH